MATYYSDRVISGTPTPDADDGNLKVATADYTVPSGGIAAGDIIQMVKMPKNAVIADVIVKFDALVATCNIKVGIGGDTDKFIDDVQCDAAITESMLVDGNIDGVGYKFTEEDTIDLVLDTAGALEDDVLRIIVIYGMSGGFPDEL